MKQLILIFVTFIAFSSNLFSQNNVDEILGEIEKNNTTLAALRKRAEAEKIANRTGIYLKNPEFEFNYLWGNPSQIGNRTDISIKQSFDFPTVYSYKNKISKLKTERVELEYEKKRKDLLLKSRLLCYDLIYSNALRKEFSKRVIHAQSIAAGIELKFKIGEVSILEYNKAQMNLLNLMKDLETNNIERNTFLGELAQLNGGIYIEFSNSGYQLYTVPVDFDLWYLEAEKSSPLLNWLKKEIEISQHQISLNQALSLPKFQTGYMSETVGEEEFKGVSFGLTIPLWENKNSVKYSKANTIALENLAIDNKLKLYNYLRILHKKVLELHNNYNDYQIQLKSFDSTKLLKKSFDSGEISLINYTLELSIYYESNNKLLELKRDMYRAYAELNQYN